MLSERELSAAIGSAAYGPDGEKIGTVEHFFTDDRTGAATWAAVSTGLFGTRHSVVPATEATFADGAVRLQVTRDAVRTAPSVSDQHLDPADEALLREHYGLGAGAPAAPAGGAVPPSQPVADTTTGARSDTVLVDSPAARTGSATGAAGQSASPSADGAMTRSEEQLRVTTERYAAKRVRVVKYVVTEEVQVTVPIRREEIRIEEVPLDPDGPAVVAGTVAAGGLPEVIVLHTERPVVTTEVVPVERVRLRTELVQEQVQVRDQVRRERIDVDEDRRPGE